MAAPTLESHSNNVSSGGTTTTIAVTAAGTGRVIVVATVIGASVQSSNPTLTISSVDANIGAWKKIGGVPTTGTAQGLGAYAWYAVTSGAVSGAVVTVASSMTIDDAASAYLTVAGANTGKPLDLNAVLATGASNGTGARDPASATPAMNVAVKTNTANVLACTFMATNAGSITWGSPTSGATLTETRTNTGGTRYATFGLYTIPFTSIQTTGVAVGSTVTSSYAVAGFAFGVTADSQGATGQPMITMVM